jgi:hypothetical protein
MLTFNYQLFYTDFPFRLSTGFVLLSVDCHNNITYWFYIFRQSCDAEKAIACIRSMNITVPPRETSSFQQITIFIAWSYELAPHSRGITWADGTYKCLCSLCVIKLIHTLDIFSCLTLGKEKQRFWRWPCFHHQVKLWSILCWAH